MIGDVITADVLIGDVITADVHLWLGDMVCLALLKRCSTAKMYRLLYIRMRTCLEMTVVVLSDTAFKGMFEWIYFYLNAWEWQNRFAWCLLYRCWWVLLHLKERLVEINYPEKSIFKLGLRFFKYCMMRNRQNVGSGAFPVWRFLRISSLHIWLNLFGLIKMSTLTMRNFV